MTWLFFVIPIVMGIVMLTYTFTVTRTEKPEAFLPYVGMWSMFLIFQFTLLGITAVLD